MSGTEPIPMTHIGHRVRKGSDLVNTLCDELGFYQKVIVGLIKNLNF